MIRVAAGQLRTEVIVGGAAGGHRRPSTWPISVRSSAGPRTSWPLRADSHTEVRARRGSRHASKSSHRASTRSSPTNRRAASGRSRSPRWGSSSWPRWRCAVSRAGGSGAAMGDHAVRPRRRAVGRIISGRAAALLGVGQRTTPTDSVSVEPVWPAEVAGKQITCSVPRSSRAAKWRSGAPEYRGTMTIVVGKRAKASRGSAFRERRIVERGNRARPCCS